MTTGKDHLNGQESAASPGSDAVARGGIERLGPKVRAVLAQLGTAGRREKPKVGKGGAFEIGSESFRKSCAILEDGTVLIAREYNDGELAGEEAELRTRYDLPPVKERAVASLDEVAAAYGEVVTAVVSSTPTRGQLRLRRLLGEAEAMGASDIKLVEHARHGDVRIKAGAGEHTHGAQWQADELEQAVNWIYNHRDGGDGQPSKVKGVPAPFSIGHAGRLSGMPQGIGALRGQLAWHGDVKHFLNLRLLPKVDAAKQSDLAGLGLDEDILDALAEERRSESGLVIIAGSTGDGKSTTLTRHLARLYEERDGTISIYTLEDPIEYPLGGDGIVQFAVKPGRTPEERSANWAEALMVFVRTNPDVGMISEIRSAADVNEILHFVSSGHKVYTTVHSDSANGVLFRLISLGVLPSELSGPGTVNLVMRQKLVPEICRHCAEEVTGPALVRVRQWLEEDRLFASAAQPEGIRPLKRNPEGCPRCMAAYAHLSGAPRETAKAAWAGYAGRRATAEFIRVDDDYRRLLGKRDALGAREHWLAPENEGGMGGIPLGTRLRRLVATGAADFEQVTNEVLPEPLRAITGPGASLGARRDAGRAGANQ